MKLFRMKHCISASNVINLVTNWFRREDWGLKAHPHGAISRTQPYSNSMIRKLSLQFQHNSTKESYDTNRIVYTGLKVPHHLNSYCLVTANKNSKRPRITP